MAEALRRSTITLSEAIIVSAICFGLFIFWSTQAVLSGFPEAKFTDSSNAWSIFIEIVLGSVCLLYTSDAADE